ncbi:MAG: ATP-dependent 6-phosphofructokinase 3 [Candidatus Hydrogenedentota bacterium]
MGKKSAERKVRSVGILTSGGDCPGLNAVIRAVGKALMQDGVEVFGFLEGFKGLIENRYVRLTDVDLSGLLMQGGTILRTSRVKPYKVPGAEGSYRDMTGAAIQTYQRLNLDCLVCLGGGGTQKNAYHLMKEGGVNVVTAPKTIDNDVWGTDICFGFDTAMSTAAEAMDRLHTTASSHHRVMVCDVMGHNSGWLALYAGVASGADVILIPEIPYSMDVIAQYLLDRMREGKHFSIVAVAEGAVSGEEAKKKATASKIVEDPTKKKKKKDKKDKTQHTKEPVSAILAEHLERVTGLETRITSVGYLQRGGVPTPTDRWLCTAFGVKAAELVIKREFGMMVSKQGESITGVDLKDIVGKKRLVPVDHPVLLAARAVGTCMGDTYEE